MVHFSRGTSDPEHTSGIFTLTSLPLVSLTPSPPPLPLPLPRPILAPALTPSTLPSVLSFRLSFPCHLFSSLLTFSSCCLFFILPVSVILYVPMHLPISPLPPFPHFPAPSSSIPSFTHFKCPHLRFSFLPFHVPLLPHLLLLPPSPVCLPYL